MPRLPESQGDPNAVRASEPDLDPEDWAAFRRDAHRMLDDALDYVQTIRSRPVWRPLPKDVRLALREPPPTKGEPLRHVHAAFMRWVLPYATGNVHPGFMGWVHGGGNVFGILGEMLAAAINANLGGRDHAPIEVERQVIRWVATILGLPEGAGGLFVTGTSIANFMGVLTARVAAVGPDIRREGLGARRLVAYASEGAHECIPRAMDMAGLGTAALRRVPVDASYRMDVDALARMVACDREAGFAPFLVVATAGTVDVGAIDDLDAAANFARSAGLWLHVDGAFGALGVLAESLRPLLSGLEKADSVALDFHKWGQVPYDAGCFVARDAGAMLRTFATDAAYLRKEGRGLAAGGPWPVDMGPDLSRGFRALKVWFTLKTIGLERLGRSIEKTCELARYFARRIDAESELERVTPVGLNVVCFRYRFREDEDRRHADLCADLQESGLAAPSTTRIGGRVVLRVAIVNHRTDIQDVDHALDAILLMGRARDGGGGWPRPFAAPGRNTDPETPAIRLTRVLAMADIAPVARGWSFVLAELHAATFDIGSGAKIRIDPSAAKTTSTLRFVVRHAVELCMALEDGSEPVLAGLRAARIAALFSLLEGGAAGDAPPPWLAHFSSIAPPSSEDVRRAWELLASHQPGATTEVEQATIGRFRSLFPLLGPTEYLLGSGGDTRLSLEAETGLNAYGCSPRPRPWAITFASSTASSASERGYDGAESARRHLLRDALAEGTEAALAVAAARIRRALRDYFALPAGTEVALTPSGTDGELCALAITCLAQPVLPITNVLIAPEESGAGVPLASTGRHFAMRTARGVSVGNGEMIDGFPKNVERVGVPVRTDGGAVRPQADIAADCSARIDAAVGAGRRVLLHVIDQSKAGLVAPSDANALREGREGRVDVVVDACQGRLSVESVQEYLRSGFMVLVTGSKFFTGPPFAGALFVPPLLTPRLYGTSRLPLGLADYSSRSDWPGGAFAASALPPSGSPGLALRWEAALAEMDAFANVRPAEVRTILAAFGGRVADAIRAHTDLVLHDAPPLARKDGEAWDALRTIFTFSIRTPGPDGRERLLSPDETRHVYRWLNADLTDCIPASSSSEEQALASRRVHLGQPIALRTPGGGVAGALRISAGARLVSGEPSLAHLATAERLERETADAVAALDKLSLVMRNFEAVRARDPKPSFGLLMDLPLRGETQASPRSRARASSLGG